MRVAYNHPSVSDFEVLFSNGDFHNNGGSLSNIKTYNSPVYIQRGSGIFSVLGNIVRNSIPFIRRLILPAMGDFSKNVIDDYANGAPLRQSMKKRGISTLKRVGRNIMSGGKRKSKVIKRNKYKTIRRKKNNKKNMYCR